MNIQEHLLNSLQPFNKDRAWIFVIVKPGFLDKTQSIIKEFTARTPDHEAWSLSRVRTKILLPEEARKLYDVHKKEDWYKDLWKYMSSGPSTAIIFTRDEKMSQDMFNEVNKIKDMIREKWGESEMRNVMHSSDSVDRMLQESGVYF